MERLRAISPMFIQYGKVVANSLRAISPMFIQPKGKSLARGVTTLLRNPQGCLALAYWHVGQNKR